MRLNKDNFAATCKREYDNKRVRNPLTDRDLIYTNR